MVDHRTIATAGLAAGGVALAASSSASAVSVPAGTVDDFSDWSDENDLGEFTGAGEFENGGGSGTVSGDALRLEYDDAGWFLSNVREDLSDYAELVLTVTGDDGGEEDDITLEIGNVRDTLSNLTDDSIGTSSSTVTVDLVDAGVDRSMVQDIWLTFWGAGSGAIELDSISIVGEEPTPPGEGLDVNGNGYDAQDLSGDGLYEDITGDGNLGFNDVVTFFEEHNGAVVQNNVEYFDFSGSGSVGFNDVVELFEMI
ncbi:hypothetical protein [Natronobiforma cellulositropha]|uniref:hypothetical protein n=1 Tax=Natronobiforma cellulositropha TaxID=1679076 RepID=UPI0021D570A2|nr:hypothetical protein [Natronobiforma cellulositropha]